MIETKKKLQTAQETPDDPEALKCVPTLKVSDIAKENKTIPTVESKIQVWRASPFPVRLLQVGRPDAIAGQNVSEGVVTWPFLASKGILLCSGMCGLNILVWKATDLCPLCAMCACRFCVHARARLCITGPLRSFICKLRAEGAPVCSGAHSPSCTP